MTKHCGLSKLLIFLVAALFCLTLAAQHSSAQQLNIGDGVVTGDNAIGLCWHGQAGEPDGNCGLLENSDHLNLILGDSLSLYLHTDGQAEGNLTSPLLLIFGVPVPNLLTFDPSSLNPFLTSANVLGAEQFDVPPPLPSFPISDLSPYLPYDYTFGNGGLEFNSAPPTIPYVGTGAGTTDFNQSNPGGGFDNLFEAADDDVQAYLDLPEVNQFNSNSFTNWSSYMFDVPEALALNGFLETLGLIGSDTTAGGLLNMTTQTFIDFLLGGPGCATGGNIPFPNTNTCITGIRLWIYEINIAGFAQGEVIHVDTTGIPLGTMVTAFGAGVDNQGNPIYLGPPATRSAMMMPFDLPQGEIPEPTSLLLLGTGLLAIGRQWRKRQGSKPSQNENQNVV